MAKPRLILTTFKGEAMKDQAAIGQGALSPHARSRTMGEEAQQTIKTEIGIAPEIDVTSLDIGRTTGNRETIGRLIKKSAHHAAHLMST